jgi:carboxyl-terminal processing protease
LFALSNGDAVYVAVSDVRVDGMRLEGVGVRPDVEVGFDRRWAGGVDPQIEMAVGVAAGEK